ncbi:MAG: hypothetical protein V1915_00585 [Candidatus Bathyarchaeota archaeon]
MGGQNLFQLLILKDDKKHSVEVKETRKINVIELTKYLNRGEAVFIKKKTLN